MERRIGVKTPNWILDSGRSLLCLHIVSLVGIFGCLGTLSRRRCCERWTKKRIFCREMLLASRWLLAAVRGTIFSPGCILYCKSGSTDQLSASDISMNGEATWWIYVYGVSKRSGLLHLLCVILCTGLSIYRSAERKRRRDKQHTHTHDDPLCS